MENASCIFYRENTVTGKQDHETLFAHEIAHQWFGDAVSELNWHHIWISEGFATYLTDLYLEHIYGREVFLASMKEEKEQVLRLCKTKIGSHRGYNSGCFCQPFEHTTVMIRRGGSCICSANAGG